MWEKQKDNIAKNLNIGFMKTRTILMIAFVAVATLSFTFANVNKPTRHEVKKPVQATFEEPVGGLFADEVEF